MCSVARAYQPWHAVATEHPAFSGSIARALAIEPALHLQKPSYVRFLSSFHHLPKVTFSDTKPLTPNHIWPIYSLSMIF
jgi:hypothetical protein